LRNGPEVSANANSTFYVSADQKSCTANLYGGTSFAAPMWAGNIALANQQLVANGKSTIGFLNPIIDPPNVTSTLGTDFHDMTSRTSGSSTAVTGYDLVTGWGSPNAGLIAAPPGSTQAASFSLSASPSTPSVSRNSSTSVLIRVVPGGGFNASISLAGRGVSISFNPSSISGGSGSSTMTISAKRNAATGTYAIAVTGSGGGVTRTTTVSLTVK
jgi:subtilase family serine protease